MEDHTQEFDISKWDTEDCWDNDMEAALGKGHARAPSTVTYAAHEMRVTVMCYSCDVWLVVCSVCFCVCCA